MAEILSNQVLLHLMGSDIQKFLQGMATNDIVVNSYSYNFHLNNQGRYLFDFFVFKDNDESYYIEINQERVEEFLRRITLYKLRNNFEIKNLSNEYKILYSKEPLEIKTLYSEKDPRFKSLGYRAIVASANINKLDDFDNELYFKDKYELAIPDGYLDLIYERSIPVEYGAEELSAISYKKGCYIGQEVISRAKYQGTIRKKIYKLQADANISFVKEKEEILDMNNNKLGVLCSTYQNQAIILLREEKYLGLKDKLAMIGENKAKILIPEWRK